MHGGLDRLSRVSVSECATCLMFATALSMTAIASLYVSILALQISNACAIPQFLLKL